MTNLLERVRAWLTRRPLEVYQHLEDFDWEEEGDN